MERILTTTYDNTLEHDGTERIDRTSDTSSWWILAFLLALFIVLCLTTGIRCGATDSCAIIDEVRPCGPNVTCTVYQVRESVVRWVRTRFTPSRPSHPSLP